MDDVYMEEGFFRQEIFQDNSKYLLKIFDEQNTFQNLFKDRKSTKSLPWAEYLPRPSIDEGNSKALTWAGSFPSDRQPPKSFP